MTANELADWIENGAPFGDYETAKQAVAMLRQQAKEIEALKLRELTDDEIKEVYDQDFDVENFGWLQLECIREILQKASEKWKKNINLVGMTQEVCMENLKWLRLRKINLMYLYGLG